MKTDSRPKELTTVQSLEFFTGSHSPHYDAEPGRRPLYQKLIEARHRRAARLGKVMRLMILAFAPPQQARWGRREADHRRRRHASQVAACSVASTRRTRAAAGREKAEGKLMKHHVMLTITSLLSIFLFSLHWADEVARGIEPGTLSAVGGLLILAVWLCGTLVLAERRAGLVIILLGAILASGVPVLHMKGAGLVGGRIGTTANTAGRFFWVWTNIGLGASGMLSVILAARALWSGRRSQKQHGV